MKRILVLMLLAILMISACSEQKDEQMEPNEQAVNNKEDSAKAVKKEVESTIANFKPTEFEEIEENEAIKFSQKGFSEPKIADSYNNAFYYGDHEVITSVIDDTTYRYNLENQSVVWKNPNVHGTTSTFELHNGVLYISEGLKTDYASVAAVSIEDGKVMKTYEHEDYKMTHHIRVYDEYLIFFAQPKNDKKDKTELLTFDIKSGKFLWAVPIDGPINTPVETKDAFLYMDNKTMEDKFNAFDKKTGEKLYTIEAKTNNSEPVVNDTGTYFVDYMESAIYKYDFEGNLLEEMNSSKNLNRYQSIQPIATPNFLVYVEDEAVVWADSNLSHEIQRIEIGETTLLKMFSTDDRIYLITRDGDSDNGEFYAVTLDLETGDIMSKVALELPYQPGFDQAHVYNDKFHFAIHSEGVKERIHYIFSGGDVHKEF